MSDLVPRPEVIDARVDLLKRELAVLKAQRRLSAKVHGDGERASIDREEPNGEPVHAD